MDFKQEQIEAVASWTPDVIVNLVGHLAWPIVVVVIAWRFRDSIKSSITNFFDRNDLTEVSISASGLTAKIEASKQESVKVKLAPQVLPEGKDAESIKKIHTANATEYSIELQANIKEHVEALNLNSTDKTNLLCTEISQLLAVINYIDITTILFVSQYNLFNKFFYPSNTVSKQDIKVYFQEAKELSKEGLKDWDVEKYLAYPLEINFIEEYDDGFRLTKLGAAYVIHLRNNPKFLDYLTLL